MTRIAVADAHALIWYATGFEKRIGRAARALLARADRGQATIFVPALVLVEMAEAVRRGVPLDGGFTRWTRRLIASGSYIVADLTAEVVLEAESLYAVAERGDRLIAATALALGHPLITRDPAFARVPALRTIW